MKALIIGCGAIGGHLAHCLYENGFDVLIIAKKDSYQKIQKQGLRIQINKNMTMIQTCVMLAPLFGLLGTVTGMIEVFQVMAFNGGGDARAMAGGVSKATLPTMAGMVVALSGVFVSIYLTSASDKHETNLRELIKREL